MTRERRCVTIRLLRTISRKHFPPNRMSLDESDVHPLAELGVRALLQTDPRLKAEHLDLAVGEYYTRIAERCRALLPAHTPEQLSLAYLVKQGETDPQRLDATDPL